MPIARASGLAVRATTSSFATAICSGRPSLNISRWAPLNSSASCCLSNRQHSTISKPTPAQLPSASFLSRSYSSPPKPIQKCSFSTSAAQSSDSSSSSPSTFSADPLNPPADCPAPDLRKPGAVYTNPYRAKRTWPPDLSKLSPKQQFRLERKYRQRAKLKWARPTWTKWTKLVQWAIIGYVIVYCVLFLDLEEGENPFQPIRDYVWGLLDGSILGSPSFQKEPTTPSSRPAKSDS
ncbi:hypothetical protein AJ79_05994 [Helicocarpus griseus UAMH5409]|uniref:Uncharacterized protein n=1 Tax=Helicocarpus griseus UAMH5409 TaxID=1447875 RepID=A0A2B7XA31_9EURO|nr:hypothetical protein AJ79_05994 [Helicocarpus griseus UAMH5409]